MLGRYVTARTLQQQYPLRPGAAHHHYSNVALRSADFAVGPREVRTPARRLIAVGTQDQMYKGHDDLLRALALLPEGSGYSLTLVGDGRCRKQLQELAARLGLSDRVRFLGRINDRERIWSELDAADLFIQPSRTEGLPRALIEAMARAVPALGTHVGGIPELLPAHQLVPPGRPDLLAAALHRLAESPTQLSRASQRGLERAADFASTNQEERVRKWLDAVQHVAQNGVQL
jgi:glycosyltransferase involved in cell wall biosynthesis